MWTSLGDHYSVYHMGSGQGQLWLRDRVTTAGLGTENRFVVPSSPSSGPGGDWVMILGCSVTEKDASCHQGSEIVSLSGRMGHWAENPVQALKLLGTPPPQATFA